MWTYTYQEELYHHGVKGMRWGHRKDRVRRDGKSPIRKQKKTGPTTDRNSLKNNLKHTKYKDVKNSRQASVGKKAAIGAAAAVGVTAATAGAAYVGLCYIGREFLKAILPIDSSN